MKSTKNNAGTTRNAKPLLAAALGVAAVLAPAVAEASPHRERDRDRGMAYAQVVDVEPQYETVRREVPREVCRTEEYTRPRGQYSATAPVLGAVIGGALGNAVGHRRSNKRVGAVVGALLGGAIGHDIARRNAAGSGYDVEEREVCRAEIDYETHERVVGYEVTYRYAGETYTTFMDHDPGPRLPVRVDVRPESGHYTRERWR